MGPNSADEQHDVTRARTRVFRAVQQDRVPAWWGTLAAPDPLFSDPRWLDLFARSRGETGTWWFGAGRGERPEIGLRGAVAESGTRKSMNPYRWLFERTGYHDRTPLDAAGAPPRGSWFPALLCSYPGLEAYPVGAGAGDPELVRLLLAGLARWAAERGMATVVVGFVQPERRAVAAGAAAAGYTALPVATRSTLVLAGRGATEDFAALPARQRNNARRLRARLAARGVEVAPLDDPLAELDTLVALRCAHARQHGKEPDPAEERSWLGPLLTQLGERVTVFGARGSCGGDGRDGDGGRGDGGRDDVTFPRSIRGNVTSSRLGTGAAAGAGPGGGAELRAFSLFVDDGRCWHAFAVARRDPADDRDVYFELMYHVPIEHAATRGIGEISFGYGTEEAKRRRGCTQVRVPAWFHAADPAVSRWLAAAAYTG